jgi:CBS domain-containing protein
LRAKELLEKYFDDSLKHQGYPVVNEHGSLIGIVTRSNLLRPPVAEAIAILIVADLMEREPIVAYPDESCRSAAERMAQCGVGRLPVVSREDPRKLLGIVTRSDLLKVRARVADEEQRREQFIRYPRVWRRRGAGARPSRQRPNDNGDGQTMEIA